MFPPMQDARAHGNRGGGGGEEEGEGIAREAVQCARVRGRAACHCHMEKRNE